MVDAITSDCRVLLARFEEKLSVRFEAFCEVWRQMNFSLMHYARPSEWEKIQIVDCLFRTLSKYLLSTCPLQYQVGAIYAIYSIYNTQLVKPKIKVRVTLLVWKDLLELQEKVKEQKHYDVYYVISSLKADKAFVFVAMPIQLACGSREAISVYERELTKEAQQSGGIQNVLESLQRVKEIDRSYNETKTKICSPIDGEPLVDPVTLSVASDDLVLHLQRDIGDFQEWKQTNKRKQKIKEMTRPPELGLPDDRRDSSDQEKEREQETRGQRVREMKERLYKTVPQVSKSNRRYQPVPAKKNKNSGKKQTKRT